MEKSCTTGFLVVNTVGDPKVDPRAAADAAADISDKRLIELVRAGAGVPDLAVKIDGVARWRATSDVARRFRDGRIFLAGDAAHLMPPNGGFGGNTGIHDAHNLAWKLALVLKGVVDPKLLETYEVERKPVSKFTVEQAYTRYVTRTATYLGAKDFQAPAPDFNIELGYLYRSPAIAAENGEDNGEDRTRRSAPHLRLSRVPRSARLAQSRRPQGFNDRSLRPLVRPARDLRRCGLVCRDAPGSAAVQNARSRGLCVGTAPLRDPDLRFAEAYGLSGGGAVLVRPDGFVAWRARSLASDPEGVLVRTLEALLATPNAAWIYPRRRALAKSGGRFIHAVNASTASGLRISSR